MRKHLTRLVDLREGEGLPVLQAFGSLFLLIASHTMLETARDALFLGKLAPSRLTLVYGLLAGLALVASAWNAKFIRYFGRRNALIFTLMGAAYGTTLLHFQPQTPAMVFLLYVWSALLGTVMVVQFWMFAGQLFTVAQGKRLFGPIAAGGVLGAVAGATASLAALELLPVASLLLVASAVFVATAVLLTTVETDENRAPAVGEAAAKVIPRGGMALFRGVPYLKRVALLTALSTAAVLTADYLFKAAVVETVPKAQLGAFFARTYAVLNAIALVVQVAISGPLVRRLGVVAAVMVMPAILVLGGAGTAAFGGTMAMVLLTKGADGALRHSLHRVVSELLTMPLSAEVRDRSKPLLDTVLTRGVQAAMAGVILALATLGLAQPRVLGALVAILAAGWLAVAVGLRRPYLDLFRQALSKGAADSPAPDLDLGSVEAVMEALSAREASRVIAAMDVLADKKRERLIPGLILYHESEEVLIRALEILGHSARRDWVPLGERLLSHASEPVRVAAVRALAATGVRSALERGIRDPSPAVRAHAALCLVNAEEVGEPLRDSRVSELLAIRDTAGDEAALAAQLALLDAIRDNGDARWAEVILAIAQGGDPRLIERSALAMARVKDSRFIPILIDRLTVRDGRGSVREAIVALGEPALEALERAMRDPATDARVRLHIPRTIGRFGSQRASDFLTEQLGREQIGLVRYKVLRGLGRLVSDNKVRIDRQRIGTEMRSNLVEHLRVLSLHVIVQKGQRAGGPRAAPSGRLILGLLEDKMKQSLERAFRLLQIAHRNEDIRSVYFALRSTDKRVRANALEYLDALTAGRADLNNHESRELLRLVADDLEPAERALRAAAMIPALPPTYEAAVVLLMRERDESLAALAAYHALELDLRTLRVEVEEAVKDRPSLMIMGTLSLDLGAEAALGR